jgi:hypothetical protein
MYIVVCRPTLRTFDMPLPSRSYGADQGVFTPIEWLVLNLSVSTTSAGFDSSLTINGAGELVPRFDFVVFLFGLAARVLVKKKSPGSVGCRNLQCGTSFEDS